MFTESKTLDATFSALSDSTRRRILKRLAAGDTAVSDLAGPFKMTLPAVIKHLRVLEKAGLVKTTKEGRVRSVRIEAAPMRKANEWLETYRIFWESSLDNLVRYLESETESKRPDTDGKKPGRKK
ncbi:MAG TPA: metalloregulator ArsR/SmtB family transcription factor [Chthoniobacteraceae bacterium]|nr:metalloregulator ArsR/SmtB family transcription factor [Chthoniobacteraceae bacterium]